MLDGTKILREIWGENVLIPLYDNEESVCGICFNGEYFYFQKNLQGDIISVTDKDANEVAKYTYDAWGVCTITSDTSTCNIATINPFRYRGYYYDNETQLYYMHSRNYNPKTGRFLNGDEVETTRITKGIMILNLFTYCENDPVNNMDVAGFASLKTVLSDLFTSIISAAGKLADCLLKAYGMSKRTYANKKKYKTATSLMSFVNDNKKTLQKTSSVLGRIDKIIEIITIIKDCYPLINGINFQNYHKQIAELLFYAIKIVASKLVGKFISWILTLIVSVAWWLKYLFEIALEMIFDWLLDLGVDALKQRFIGFLEKNKVGIDFALSALFKSVRACC